MATPDSKFLPRPQFNDLKSDAQRGLYTFWDGLRGDAPCPSTAALDPMDMPIEHLPWVGLLETQREPLKFLIRLWGTGIRDGGIAEFTGRDLLDFKATKSATERGIWVLENKAPYLYAGPLEWPHDRYNEYSVLNLPFANDDGEVSRLALIFEFRE